MSRHSAQYRPMDYRRRNLWSVACACGWICDAPLRGDQDRAREVWRQHRDAVNMEAVTRDMRRIPHGAKGADL